MKDKLSKCFRGFRKSQGTQLVAILGSWKEAVDKENVFLHYFQISQKLLTQSIMTFY